MKKAAIILCCCAAAVGGVVVGATVYPLLNTPRAKFYTLLNAEYTITGRNLIDPGPEDKKDRVAIYIRGDGAREIYKAMPVSEEPSPCNDADSPMRYKTAGGLTCSGGDKDGYSCGVAVKLDDGKTENAFAC
jgi:hypothetical protein